MSGVASLLGVSVGNAFAMGVRVGEGVRVGGRRVACVVAVAGRGVRVGRAVGLAGSGVGAMDVANCGSAAFNALQPESNEATMRHINWVAATRVFMRAIVKA